MTRISTHILDTARGMPASDVPVCLERQQNSGQWQTLASARTDADGRCQQLLREGEMLTPGTYRLTFDSASYHAAQGVTGFYPIVEVTFTVRDGQTHLHIPLLLSPNGYTTYRGS